MTDITDASPRLRDLNDICERLRKEIAWEQDVGELLEKAAAEIARLRLTDEEREAVAWAVLDSRGMVCVAYVCREAAEAYCEGTFNRLAPLYRQPQDGVVRLPPLDPNGAPGWNAAIGAVREALSNAGVDWDTE